MPGTYTNILPDVFPYRARVPLDQLPGLITMLSMPRTGAPNGSSFAITSDAPEGFRHIWLSNASLRALSDTLGRDPEAWPAVNEIEVPE